MHVVAQRRLISGAFFLALASALAILSVAQPGLADTPVNSALPPGEAALPHIVIDLKKHRVLVDCQALNITAPLEFFCVEDGGNEHESVLRTPAKASDVHTALLMLGLKPGGNVRYVQSTDTWLPPYGPPLHIFCDYILKGRAMHVPAYRMMRSDKTHQPMPSFTWVFCGSKVMSDGTYAADVTSYVVSVVNFDYTLIDVPALKSNSNETLEWEENPDMIPPKGTPVTMIIEPAAQAEDAAGGNANASPDAGAAANPNTPTAGSASPSNSNAAAGADNGPGPFGDSGPPLAAPATAPSGPILMKLITIDAAGNVTVDHAAIAVDQITDLLTNLKKTRPVKATIAAADNAPRDTLDKVIVAVANADVQMDFTAVGGAAHANAATPPGAAMPPSPAAPANDSSPPADGASASATQPAGSADDGANDAAGSPAQIAADQARIDALKQQWEQAVAPHRDALRSAAEAHYDIINSMRREQQRLIDQADRIQRTIDQLEKQYEDMTTPAPPPLATQPSDQPNAAAAPGQ